MDYHLEREIRLSEESEYKNLYSWSLQEFNENGEKIGDDQVPWKWNLYFIASELRHYRSINIDRSNESDEEKNNEPVEESERIYAILHPGTCRDGKYLEEYISYSMFGTDRRVNEFFLWIYKLEDNDEKESCRLWGGVSSTDFDYRDETTDDQVEISLWFAPDRFNRLVDLIKTERVDRFQILLGRVSGFYSEWSPSISTNNIKILTPGDQKILFPENCEIVPPRLGEVGRFNISIIQRKIINPKQDLRRIDINKLFEEPDDHENEVYKEQEYTEAQLKVTSLSLTQLRLNEKALIELHGPLWLIFVALLFILMLILVNLVF